MDEKFISRPSLERWGGGVGAGRLPRTWGRGEEGKRGRRGEDKRGDGKEERAIVDCCRVCVEITLR